MNKGQGLVEYALILILVAVVVIVILAVLGPNVGNLFNKPCMSADSFECKNARVEQCLASEQYSREECIALMGGNGKP